MSRMPLAQQLLVAFSELDETARINVIRELWAMHLNLRELPIKAIPASDSGTKRGQQQQLSEH